MVKCVNNQVYVSLILASIGVLCPLQAMEKDTPSSVEQIVGTQAFNCCYHLEDGVDVRVEQAWRILKMGSTIIKTFVQEVEEVKGIHTFKPDIDKEGHILPNSAINEILTMNWKGRSFHTFFFWWRSDSAIWKAGLSTANKEKESKMTYNFATNLLERNHELKHKYFIGNWEGDSCLLFDADKHLEPEKRRFDESKVPGMIAWLQTRQHAVKKARKDMKGQTQSEVYHYVEVNLVKDALYDKKPRLVTEVLKPSGVDYVSYSSYDVQLKPLKIIEEVLNFIEKYMPENVDINGSRVFIGEFSYPARPKGMQLDAVRHEKMNRDILINFLQCRVLYILYWQMYNNELENKEQRGFWLIDDLGREQPLYRTFRDLFEAQKSFTDLRTETIQWLNERL
jgi:hypothetical protein